MWLTLPFYDFCGFRSVAVNSVYKLQFFYIYVTDIVHQLINEQFNLKYIYIYNIILQ